MSLMIKSMTDDEFLYMKGELNNVDTGFYHEVGTACFENGWIDVFGLTTQQGMRALERYEKEEWKDNV